MGTKTEVYGLSPEEFKDIIVGEIKKEILITLKTLNLSTKKDEDEYLSRKEASEFLKVSLPTISDWSDKGIIKAKRIGNLIRFSKKGLEESMINIKKNK